MKPQQWVLLALFAALVANADYTPWGYWLPYSHSLPPPALPYVYGSPPPPPPPPPYKYKLITPYKSPPPPSYVYKSPSPPPYKYELPPPPPYVYKSPPTSYKYESPSPPPYTYVWYVIRNRRLIF
ncbi:hypothetical protein ACS0TY_003255 [Phlomoides rotata]